LEAIPGDPQIEKSLQLCRMGRESDQLPALNPEQKPGRATAPHRGD
jgi:hypothetical protein